MEIYRIVCLFGAFVLALMAGFLPGDSESNPEIALNWEMEVFATGLRRVDNLAMAPDGALYATLENEGAEGRLVQVTQGGHEVLLDHLDRPDGLLYVDGMLFVTEEVEGGRVFRFDPHSGQVVPIAWLNKPEGIEMTADYVLVVSEDLERNGRVAYLNNAGTTSTIVGDLRKPEGIALSPAGEIYVAESTTGRILSVSEHRTEKILDGLNAPDQIEFADDGALWIGEDVEEGRVLRFADGELESIVSGLENPQGLAFGDDGWVYVAEQGRDRIIRLRSILQGERLASLP